MSIAKTKKQITFNVALSEEADFLVDGLIFLINKLEKFLFFEIKEKNISEFFRRIFSRQPKINLNRKLTGLWQKIEGNFHFSGALTEEAKIFLAGIFVVGSVLWIGNGDFVLVAHSEQNSGITNAQAREGSELKNTEGAGPLKFNSEIPKAYSTKSREAQCQEDKERKKSSNLCGKDDIEELKKIEKERIARAIASAPKPRAVVLSCGESNYGHPQNSPNKGNHADEDCCPDPDEWPRPGCVYDARGYSIMLSRR